MRMSSVIKLTKSQPHSVSKTLYNYVPSRSLNCSGDNPEMAGLILGVYSKDDDPYGTWKALTETAKEYDEMIDHRLWNALTLSGPVPKLGEVRLFYGMEPKFTAVAVVGLGDECLSYNEPEQIDESKEAIRSAVGLGARTLQAQHMREIHSESFGHAESSAEGTAMGVWMYQELKSNKRIIPRLELYNNCDYIGWQIGLQKAAAQNLSRQLSETPANLLTPIGFSQAAVEVLARAGVSVEVKVKDWANIVNMDAFISAAKGSCEPPIWLELHYYGCDPDVSPIVLVGKGVTFDSGGLCIKTVKDMKDMRGDVSGAAVVLSTIRAISALKLPLNVRGLIPLYENMPGACALKPGDIIRSRSGKTILIHNTDFDGRLSIADAITYGLSFNPKFVVTVGNFSKESIDAFDEPCMPVFSNNDQLFETLKIASIHTGDRVWRMPLWKHFTEKVTWSLMSDVTDFLDENPFANKRAIDSAMLAQPAAFLREFVTDVDWVHLETFNVNISSGKTFTYLPKGMSGRPTRTLIEFLAQLACTTDDALLGPPPEGCRGIV